MKLCHSSEFPWFLTLYPALQYNYFMIQAYTDQAKATPSCTSVSGPGFFKGSCGRALHQHHSHQYKLMNAGLSSLKS